jgi:hypothetical protein
MRTSDVVVCELVGRRRALVLADGAAMARRCHAEGVSRQPISGQPSSEEPSGRQLSDRQRPLGEPPVGTTSGRLYRERLWPGPLGWSFVLGFALFAFIALLPVAVSAATVAAAVTLAGGVAVAVGTSPVVEVAGGELRVADAHIPVGVLGTGRVLDQAGVRAALGPGSDARAFVCIRAWTRTAVTLTVEDPADPTPSWLVSTRHPSALLAAVRAVQGGDQTAHSVQIS